MNIGRKIWAIADGYIPEWSNGKEPEMTSHEAISFLNTNDREARIKITVYFSDQEPIGPFHVRVPAKRTKHIRFNNLTDPAPIPHGTDYAALIESDIPVVAQHTRLDSRQAENGLFSTIPFAGNE